MTDQDLSELFNRHAFDPWHPDNRGRDCSVVMDREAFYEAARDAIAAETRRRAWEAETERDALRLIIELNKKGGGS